MVKEKKAPTGTKQTEVGLIPDDWTVKKVKDVCILINGRGFKPYEWKDSGLPIIRIQNLNGSEDFNFYDGAFNPKILVENGQLLFAWSGSKGTSFGPHIWEGSTALLNYHTWKVDVIESKIDKDFFFHILKILTKKIEEKAHGASALVHTQKKEMEEFDIPFPASLMEQRAISEALSDMDAFIASLDRLITKKRNIKLGAMQQLLTGKTRLSDFRRAWEVKKLGDIAAIDSDNLKGDTNPEYSFEYISLEDVDRGILKSTSHQVFSSAPSRARRVIKKNDILVATVRPNLKSHLFILDDRVF